MGTLADAIEHYLRQMLLQQESLEIQRRQLARIFRCAPSQINYVLNTRFTPERGYVVESRRGGGGYLRITVLTGNGLVAAFGEQAGQEEVAAMLARLIREGTISGTEARLLQRNIQEALAVFGADPGAARACLLRMMLVLLDRHGKTGE